MMTLIEKLMPWGPLFFGVMVFAPMWAAALDAAGIVLAGGVANLAFTLALGAAWGLYAKIRGRWL